MSINDKYDDMPMLDSDCNPVIIEPKLAGKLSESGRLIVREAENSFESFNREKSKIKNIMEDADKTTWVNGETDYAVEHVKITEYLHLLEDRFYVMTPYDCDDACTTCDTCFAKGTEHCDMMEAKLLIYPEGNIYRILINYDTGELLHAIEFERPKYIDLECIELFFGLKRGYYISDKLNIKASHHTRYNISDRLLTQFTERYHISNDWICLPRIKEYTYADTQQLKNGGE